MKVFFCLAFLIVIVAAEHCEHDNDCTKTVCRPGFRVDCHHIDHHHIDTHVCTCKDTNDHHCQGDDWCRVQHSDDDCDPHDGETWHCSTNGDNKCRCYCDHRHGKCKRYY